MAKSGADSRDFVRCNGYADTAAADEKAPLGSTLKDRESNRLGEVRIIDRLRTVGAKVEEFKLGISQPGGDFLLEKEAGMIRTDSDFHEVPVGCTASDGR